MDCHPGERPTWIPAFSGMTALIRHPGGAARTHVRDPEPKLFSIMIEAILGIEHE
jgi:hypothetical protein